jgi:RHS repeat-associated protein
VDLSGATTTVANTFSTTGLLTQQTTTGYVNGVSTTYSRRSTYDARGRVLTETGPRTDLTQTTTYTYYADNDADAARAGQLNTLTDALNHVTTYAGSAGFTSYTPFGDAQSLVDPNGVTTQFSFDARGRVTSSTVLPTTEGEPALVTREAYDQAGRRTQRTLPAGNSVVFGYDTSGRLTVIGRMDAAALKHERLLVMYNAFDQMTSVAAQNCPAPATSCAGWNTTWGLGYIYSATTSDLTQITHPDNTSKQFTYTGHGALATLNDENHPTGGDYSNSYDLAGRLLIESRTLSGTVGGVVTTRYAYDVGDDVTSITDPNGNVTSYHYDDFGRMTKETSPASGITTYVYDADNNVTLTTNANGTSSTYIYDALDRAMTENDTKAYNNARWYRPGWGRHTQDDPLDIGTTSPYTYANANPLSFVDRDGQYAKRPYNDPRCAVLRATIQNLFDRVNKRIGQLHEDPLGLPERAPGDSAKPSTSRWGAPISHQQRQGVAGEESRPLRRGVRRPGRTAVVSGDIAHSGSQYDDGEPGPIAAAELVGSHMVDCLADADPRPRSARNPCALIGDAD